LPIPACSFVEKTYNSAMEGIRRNSLTAPKLAKGVVGLAVGILLIGWLMNTPAGLLGKADAVAYAVCHRINVRSFHMGDRQISLCARCTGMYLGAMLAMVYQTLRFGRRSGMPGRSALVVFGLFTVAFGLDGLNSYISLFPGAPTAYQPQNWLRLITGTGMGLAMGGVLLPVFNQTVWQRPDPAPAFSNGFALVPMIGLAGIVDLIVLTENPLALYPLALISAAGVLVLLTMVYCMLWMMYLHLDNRFTAFAQVIWPLVGGFGTALLQIALIDLLRYTLTGTWAGFKIG
jgi:uncharacterized membrane protein